MRERVLLISFILSLPFWWGVNVLANNLEGFVFEQELLKNPQTLTAQLDQKIFEEELKKTEITRERRERLANLDIQTRAAISLEVDSSGQETILFEKNSGEPLPIASLTKLMTALVVFGLSGTYDPSQLITITKEAISQDGQSKYGDLRIGEKLSVDALLHIMLIESSNDAAFAFTQPIGEEGFVNLMNIYGKNLGLLSTIFVNPTGLEPDNPAEQGNLSSAKNLAELAEYLLKNYPQIFQITSQKSYNILKPDGSLHHFIPQNTNELLGEIHGIIGGKTGWSPQALGCLLLILKDPENNGYFINVVLGADDRFSEMRKIVCQLLACPTLP